MKQFIDSSKFIMVQMLLALVVGCTAIGPAPSPTSGIQTEAVMIPSSMPSTEPAVFTPTQTQTPPLTATSTSTPTLTPSPTNTLCATPANWSLYTVQPGDNLIQIALLYNMTVEDLRNANCLPAADTILVGQKLSVPYYLPPVLAPPVSARTEIPSSLTGLPPNLKEEISFDSGGANEVPLCADPTPGGSRQITISERLKDMFELCVYGFPAGEDVTVELYAPDQHMVALKKFEVPAAVSGQTKIRIPLWMPVGVPTGSWSVTVRLDGDPLEKQPFMISAFTGAAINTMPKGEINPFAFERKCDFYTRGAEVVIRGTNFAPDGNLPVGIYLYTSDVPLDSLGYYKLPLINVHSAVVNQGSFSVSVTVQPADLAGVYWIIPVSDLNKKEYTRRDIRNDCYQVE